MKTLGGSTGRWVSYSEAGRRLGISAVAVKKQVDRLRRACGQTPIRLSSAARTHVTEVLRSLTGAIDGGKQVEADALAAAEAWRP